MTPFNKKPLFPWTYGDQVENDDVRLSNYVVALMKTEKFQSYATALFFALLTLGSYAQPSSAIPADYGEAANELLNQAAQNGAAAGGAPVAPPIGKIEGHVPRLEEAGRCFVPAMPLEQQQLLAAQQMGQLGAMPPGGPVMPPGGPVMPPGGPVMPPGGPANPPSFYIPPKPRSTCSRAINTVLFTSAMGVVCINAAWGEPVAILMCSTGLCGVAYKLGKEVVLFLARNIK